MRIITILCFQYPKNSYLHLPSSYIDLYWTYLYAISICSNIRVFTDLTEQDDNLFSQRYNELVEQHVITGGYVNLIGTIKQKGHYCYYKQFGQMIKWFKQIVDDVAEPRHHLIYFSGHSIRQIMLLNTEAGLGLSDLIRLSDYSTRSYDQTFIVLDCCLKESKFPYIYNQNGHWDPVQSESNSSLSNSDIIGTTGQIICWCSTRQNQALASQYGSIFTNILFGALSKIHLMISSDPKMVNLDLISLINGVMGVARNQFGLDFDVYCNRDDITRLWPWVVNCPADFYFKDGCFHLIIDGHRPAGQQCPNIPEQDDHLSGVELRWLDVE